MKRFWLVRFEAQARKTARLSSPKAVTASTDLSAKCDNIAALSCSPLDAYAVFRSAAGHTARLMRAHAWQIL